MGWESRMKLIMLAMALATLIGAFPVIAATTCAPVSVLPGGGGIELTCSSTAPTPMSIEIFLVIVPVTAGRSDAVQFNLATLDGDVTRQQIGIAVTPVVQGFQGATIAHDLAVDVPKNDKADQRRVA